MGPIPSLTPQALELYAWLAEELAETIQAVGKTLRHGPDSRWPIGSTNPTNQQDVERELGHVQHVLGRMVDTGLISREAVMRAAEAKAVSSLPYLHHQPKIQVQDV